MKHQPQYHLTLVPFVLKRGHHLGKSHNLLICYWALVLPVAVCGAFVTPVFNILLDAEPDRVFNLEL